MEGKSKKKYPRAILVFGAPSSGKTTFCKKFSVRFGVAFYDLDEIKTKNGFDRKTILFMIKQILKTKQNILIEGGIDTEAERQELTNILLKAGYHPTLVWIQTDINTIKTRLKKRYPSASEAKTSYDEKVSRIEAPSATEQYIVISGKHTFQTQLKHVLSQL